MKDTPPPPPETEILRSAMAAATARLHQAAVPEAARDVRLLLAAACNLTGSEVVMNRNSALPAAALKRFHGYVERRLGGEPVSRILGRREFWGLEFSITPHTLDPRPETELLVQAALEHVKACGLVRAPLRVLDLGTGSGCLLAALLTELPQAWGLGIDRSPEAIRVARKNLQALDLLPRGAFLCADWAQALAGGSFDVIVSNPPYIAASQLDDLARDVRDFDPHTALNGGPDGLECYRKLMPGAINALNKNGFFVLETGTDQALDVRDILTDHAPGESFSRPEILMDLARAPRAVATARQSS